MPITLLLSTILLSAITNAELFLRISCPGGYKTINNDPLLSPGSELNYVNIFSGTFPSHQVSAVSASSLLSESCTGCSFAEDHSLYWSVALARKNALNEIVGPIGSIEVFYESTQDATALPSGLVMLAGNVLNIQPNPQIGFYCLNYSNPSESHVLHHSLPDQVCSNGLKVRVDLPDCWDGKNLDSYDHSSHMAYSNSGSCPSSHPTKLIKISILTQWDTQSNIVSENFLFSNGAAQPYVGFINGWETQTLNNVLSKCSDVSSNVLSCKNYLTFQSELDIQQCDQPSQTLKGKSFVLKTATPSDIASSTSSIILSETKTEHHEAMTAPELSHSETTLNTVYHTINHNMPEEPSTIYAGKFTMNGPKIVTARKEDWSLTAEITLAAPKSKALSASTQAVKSPPPKPSDARKIIIRQETDETVAFSCPAPKKFESNPDTGEIKLAL